jgi:hypothetical protein
MKVKRRAATGWSEEAGVEQKELFKRISNAKGTELAQVLLTSEWSFAEQGDLLDWVTVLDQIDASLEASIKDNAGLVCTDEQPAAACPKPVCDLVRGCLRFSAILLANSIHKYVYNSIEVRAVMLPL